MNLRCVLREFLEHKKTNRNAVKKSKMVAMPMAGPPLSNASGNITDATIARIPQPASTHTPA
jgi:hypothetical protein